MTITEVSAMTIPETSRYFATSSATGAMFWIM
jgi:hypothetical protein